jgi:hypothetical protein
MIMITEAAGLNQADRQALPRPKCFFGDSVVGLVVVMRTKSDLSQLLILIGDSQAVAARSQNMRLTNTVVADGHPVVDPFCRALLSRLVGLGQEPSRGMASQNPDQDTCHCNSKHENYGLKRFHADTIAGLTQFRLILASLLIIC